MYVVVEFSAISDADSGGGVAVACENWLTPLKKEIFWPPFKALSKFNKCLLNQEEPDDTWALFKLERLFYQTADILKAREKAREALVTSDVQSEIENKENGRRKRKVPAKLLSDSAESSTSSDDEILSTKKPKRTPKKVFINHNTILDDVSAHSTPSSIRSLPRPPVITSAHKLSLSSEKDNLAFLTSSSNADNNLVLPTSSSNTGNLEEFVRHGFEKIFKDLGQIKEQNKKILAFQQAETTKLTAKVSLPDDLRTLKFPLESIEYFENYLKNHQNSHNVNAVITFWSTLGGNDVTCTTNRLLREVIADSVAKDYNFYGRNTKKAFSNLQLNTEIIKAVKIRHAGATNQDIEGVIKTWLKHAPERLKKQDQRKNKQDNVN